MRSAMRSEFLKLVTLRSTYITTGLAFLIVALGAFIGEGLRSNGSELNASKLSDVTLSTISFVTLFSTVLCLLLMSHEYRHNTITYTLTASNSRTKVLLSKIIVVIGYAVTFSLACGLIGLVMVTAGIKIGGHSLAPQEFNIALIFLRTIFYCVGYSLVGLLFGFLFRNINVSVMALILVPGPVEGLLALLLKKNAMYLPFSSLNQVLSRGPAAEGEALEPLTAGLIFSGYLIAAWVLAWWLFVRRDAN